MAYPLNGASVAASPDLPAVERGVLAYWAADKINFNKKLIIFFGAETRLRIEASYLSEMTRARL